LEPRVHVNAAFGSCLCGCSNCSDMIRQGVTNQCPAASIVPKNE
jgi:hypothetical protein